MAELYVNSRLTIAEKEISISTARSSGPGGQNVNKVASAVHLRFNIYASSLPERVKNRLLVLQDQRISKDGVLVLKAQQYRSQEKNKEDALRRLKEILSLAMIQHKKRRPTRPGKAAKKRRLEGKKQRGQLKTARKKVRY